MIKTDFAQKMPSEPGTVHFVGIGGAGMSGIASLFASAGHTVTGSDIRDTAIVAALRDEGITITIGHDARAVDGADTVVVTGAIAEDNPEYLAAKAAGLPVVHRAVALAWLSSGTRLVAVAGAHGKTTSTGMVIEGLLALDRSPSFVNGGIIRSLGVSSAAGTDDVFVVEADESDGSFSLYDTAIALITNVDPDHLDHFGSEEAFLDAFVHFASKARELVVISSDDPGASRILSRITAPRVMTFGRADDADVRVTDLDLGPTASFTLVHAGVSHRVALAVPGVHNVLNAAGAVTVLIGLGVDARAAADAVATFAGTERRFEPRGDVGGVRVFDDFAHHPTEIRAALSAARDAVGPGRLIPIFQPHLFSRTRMLAQEFADVLESLADETIVVPVYGARQDPEPGVTGELITERFADASRARYIDDWTEASRTAAAIARPGDFVIPMGGGDIYLIIPTLLAELERAQASSALR
ncbi:UDP-N-acetylmuramate--L-alanine ligase [Marisediminicola sp. LYQ85]|uniref:UDP-N-acetylmuramate--L-alanine ligase n=1 Tax=Marisediminicola sp. LYQ85 TaxID=3391062 RepID=UPI00398330F1